MKRSPPLSPTTAERLARLVSLPLRAAARLTPERVRKRLDDRLFYAIFQVTRVTNDAYAAPPEAGARTPRSSRS